MNAPHILIVAVEEEVGELYALQLASSLRARTTWVRDCAAARGTLAAGRRYDVVLLDIGVPANWDACLALPNERPGTPVIVVTGWLAHDGRFQQRAFAAGCAAFVAKPCTEEMLTSVVRRVRRGERRVELVIGGDGMRG
jgi:CheY-like chemotaxis protein